MVISNYRKVKMKTCLDLGLDLGDATVLIFIIIVKVKRCFERLQAYSSVVYPRQSILPLHFFTLLPKKRAANAPLIKYKYVFKPIILKETIILTK